MRDVEKRLEDTDKRRGQSNLLVLSFVQGSMYRPERSTRTIGHGQDYLPVPHVRFRERHVLHY